MKVGIDIVEVERFNINNLESFLEKYYTVNEIIYINSKKNKLQTIAGIFACKESVLKAFKIGIGLSISLKEIEIGHNNNIPRLVENACVLQLKKENNITNIDVSISHTDKNAIAICIIN